MRKASLFLNLESGQRAYFPIPIPFAVLELLQGILVQMAQGNAVMLVPVHAELTSQQATDQQRAAALDELAAHAQELGMGYRGEPLHCRLRRLCSLRGIPGAMVIRA